MNTELKLIRLQQMMYWLINGYNRHGIPIEMWKSKWLTPEWVEERYQIKFSNFVMTKDKFSENPYI